MALTRLKASNILDSDFKSSCRVTTATDINLSGGAPNVVDGETLIKNDRVLVRGQTTTSQNGIYKVSTVGTGSNGTWVRDIDGTQNNSITAGTLVYIESGTTYNGKFYYLSTTGSITIGTTGLSFNDLLGSVATTAISNGNSNVSVAANSNVTVSVAGNANIVTVTGTGADISGTANISGNANVGNLGTAGLITATGNVSGGNLTTTGVVSATGNVSGGNLTTAGVLSVTGNANVGNLGTAQVLATANITAPQLISNIATGTAPLVVTSTTQVANLNVATAGTVTTAAQPNITSVGTLSTLNVSGNANVGNLGTSGNITAGFFIGNGSQLTGIASGGVTYTASATAPSSPSAGDQWYETDTDILFTYVDDGTSTFWLDISTFPSTLVNGNSNISIAANSNVSISVAGNSNILVVTGTGANITGTANISGNANVGNLGATQVLASANITAPQIISNVSTGTAPFIVTSTTQVANLNVATAGSATTATSATTAGTVTTAAQPNITSLGTLSSLNVTGNANVGNLGTATVIATTGNITTINSDLLQNGNSNIAIDANANVRISVTGTANVGTFTTTGLVLPGDLAVNGGDITTTATTFNLLTANATTVNIANAATTVNIGNTSGTTSISGDLQINGDDIKSSTGNVAISLSNQDVTIQGNLSIQGVSTTIGTNDLTIEDSIINLHTNANLTPLTSNDGRDIGLRLHYYRTSDQHAFLGWQNDTGHLEYLETSTESAGVMSGAYGTIKANIFISNVATGTAPFTVNSTTQVANLNVANAAHSSTANTVVNAAQSNITSVGTLTSLNVSGNANVGNLGTATIIATTGNITTINSGLLQNGNSNVTITANGNVTVNAVGGERLVVTATGANISGTLTSTGNLSINSNFTVNASNGNTSVAGTLGVTGAATLSSTLNVIGNANTGNLGTATVIATTGNITTINSGLIQNGNSNVTITANGNVTVNAVGGTRLVLTSSGANITGTANVTGNANVGNLGTAQVLASANITSPQLISNIVTGTAPLVVTSTTQVANLNVATAGTAGTVTTAAQPNITSVGTLGSLTTSGRIQLTFDGSADAGTVNNTTMLELQDNGATSTPSMSFHRPGVFATKIVLNTDNFLYFGGWSAAQGGQTLVAGNIQPGANATYSLGTTSLRYANVFGLASSAQYADLAEKYQSDSNYDPGTVVIFGGEHEITVTNKSHDTRVAGVISTAPAYLMNDDESKQGIWLPVALTGRVPTKVKGPVDKGDLVVASDVTGIAIKLNANNYLPGCIIGKSLENITDNSIHIIEVVIGRF